MYKLPSVRAIYKHIDKISKGDARIIRAIMENYHAGEYSAPHWHASHGIAACLREIDKVMNAHGVESCTQDGCNDDYLNDDKWTAQYVNMGDTYDATIIFLTGQHPKGWTEGFKLMCWGDLYE